jgi:hypothetical protein
MGCVKIKIFFTQPYVVCHRLMINPKINPMKTAIRIMAFLAFPALLISCKDKIEQVYTVNTPVYMSYNDLRNSFKVAEGQQIIHPGKIYFKDHYIFVNEYEKGIHVIDNTNPESPQIIKFIEIPGSVDLAIRDNIMYADSYVDLVAIDISNLDDIREVKRIQNVFPYMIPECANGVVEGVDQLRGVVTGYKETERTVDVKNDDSYNYYPYWREDFMFLDGATNYAGGKSETSNTGTGGSMARFTVYDDILYTVDYSALRLFSISTPADPTMVKEMYVGWNIETLYPYEHKLFLGSTTGMFIYSLQDPANPEFISQFRHASSCDPVVVEGNYAYVTLRAGNLCGDINSQLDVIDISDIQNPEQIAEYAMEEPYGLGIDDTLLFVCDGSAGLKIYNAADPEKIDQHKLAQYNNIQAFDVIPLGNVLVMIGTDGLFQYEYSDPANIRQLSVIPIVNLQH